MENNIIQGFPSPQKDFYKVYVCSCTYNQSSYIEDCLNGVAMQETNFSFVHHVIDDASTDGEQDVIKAWMDRNCDMEHAEYYDNDITAIAIAKNKKNPNCTLVVYYLKKNLYNEDEKKDELCKVWEDTCPYEALCEGDDYWIDSKKLQKQVDYMDAHEDVVYSCHRFKIFHQNSGKYESDWNNYFDMKEHKDESLMVFDRTYAYTQPWITLTLTQLVRTSALNYEIPKSFQYYRDVHFVYMILSQGKGVYHSFVGGVYRRNEGGIVSGLTLAQRAKTNTVVYRELYKFSHDPVIKQKLIIHYMESLYYKSFILPKTSEDLICLLNSLKYLLLSFGKR